MITEVPLAPAPNPRPLAEEFPDEVAFFKKVFIWGGSREGCYVRTAYEFEQIGGLGLPKWRPITTRGKWQPLYGKLVDSLAEKHLDFHRFRRTCGSKDRLCPADYEAAFWVGTLAGVRTRTHCIDLDNHHYVGWRLVPTRWHPIHSGVYGGPYDYRCVPVVRPSLRFFMQAKLVHDRFPRRIWAFSSANLGLSVWEIFRSERPTHVIRRNAALKLRLAGVGGLEHYPCPAARTGSLGRCHRRPCGMDSGVITPDGVVTDPIEQVRQFIQPGPSPSFDQILAAYRSALNEMYESFLADGSDPGHRPLSAKERQAIVADCRKAFAEVEDWAGRGCPIDHSRLKTVNTKGGGAEDRDLSSPTPTHPPSSFSCGSLAPDEEAESDQADLGMFRAVDLPAISDAGRWVQFVRFLIETGFPDEDKFFEVVSTLARWFGLVEWHDRPREEVKDLLGRYVLTRHNNMVSRLSSGQEQDALDQVGRIVDAVLDRTDEKALAVFEDIRRRRATGCYRQIYEFGPVVLRGLPISTAPSLPSCFTCGSLSEAAEEEQGGQWEYVPDDTPLPEDETKKLFEAFRKAKRPLRRRGDSYPTLDAITRFFNYLRAGRTPGRRRASKALLVKMGFPSNGTKRKPIFDALVGAGFVAKGNYRSLEKSRLWELLGSKENPTEGSSPPTSPSKIRWTPSEPDETVGSASAAPLGRN